MKTGSIIAIILIFLSLGSCIKRNIERKPRDLHIKLESEQTKIEITEGDKVLLTDIYPRFPGVAENSPFFNRNVVKFNNNNVLMLVPDKSVKRLIKAWNDYSELFNLIFIDLDSPEIKTVLKNTGVNIRISKLSKRDEVLIFNISENTINLTIFNSTGLSKNEVMYTFKAYPDKIELEEVDSNYRIIHSNIDSEEIFIFDYKKNIIESISYKGNSSH